jgi:Ser/Thr protein kinase RdoA (MazF antagonist)
MHAGPDELEAIQDELDHVMSAWKLKPGEWRMVGQAPTQQGQREAYPILEIASMRWIVRRQQPELTENDTRFRQAFMRHLTEAGLPVPPLLPRPDGSTYGVVEDGIYELQGWLDGQPYLSDGPASDARLSGAASMLGELHQASASFEWQKHQWPEDRSPRALTSTYCQLITQAAGREGLPAALKAGLERVASVAEARIEPAASALETRPSPPELHIHGDYQAHNLAFGPGGVTAIYDFDAARWSRRVDELAYALLYFAGARWDDASALTPPLVDDGLDVLRVHSFLGTYGRVAPPAPEEARLLADAMTLAFPIVFANGIAEDLVFPDDFDEVAEEEEALARLHWADTFWLWLDRYRETLTQAWEA